MSTGVEREATPSPSREPVITHPFRHVLAASVGNLAEWYDWLVYAYVASYFAEQIFPPDSDRLTLALSSFAVFAVGFAARPAGGLLLGLMADRHGRRAAMTFAIALMGVGQAVMALMPTYEQVGVMAPVLLAVVRIAQGISTGGEFAVSAVFLVESAPSGRRGLYSSLTYVGSNLGQLLASGVVALLATLLSGAAMHDWGWRAAFAFGAVLCVSGWWIRHGTEETHTADVTTRPRMFDFLRHHPRESALVVGMTVGATVAFYSWTAFLPTYAELTVDFSSESAIVCNTIALAFFTLIQMPVGWLSDRIGRKPLLITFGLGFAVFAPASLALLENSFLSLLVVSCTGMLLLTGYTAVCSAVMCELFPARVRTAGIGLPYAATVAAFGGTAPYLATALIDRGHGLWFGGYVAALTLLSTLVYASLRETAKLPRLP